MALLHGAHEVIGASTPSCGRPREPAIFVVGDYDCPRLQQMPLRTDLSPDRGRTVRSGHRRIGTAFT